MLGERCLYRGDRQRRYGGWGMLNAVVRSSYFVTGVSSIYSRISRLVQCFCCVQVKYAVLL